MWHVVCGIDLKGKMAAMPSPLSPSPSTGEGAPNDTFLFALPPRWGKVPTGRMGVSAFGQIMTNLRNFFLVNADDMVKRRTDMGNGRI